jgi:iron(III) transport system ATP-binding protein
MAQLIIEGLHKSFAGKPILQGVDLEVASGRFVAILGASGCGKTTLLRLVCGFERVDAGTISIGDRRVAGPGMHVAPEQRHVGYVAQEGALFPHLSVADNIVFGLPLRRRRAHDRVAELLELVGLPTEFATRPPHQLSGGEQQRVALARALAPEPTLVLLDEPFSALDTALRAETRQAVAAALSAAGTTALLVTHDQPEALSMADPVAVLRDGRLIQVDSPMTLYRHPADAELARFVGEAVLLPGLARNGLVYCELGCLTLAVGMPEGAVEVLIRPEQIRLLPANSGGCIPARVEHIRYFGPDASVDLTLFERSPPTALSARVPGHSAPRLGETVGLVVAGEVVTYPRAVPEVVSDLGEGSAPGASRIVRSN